LYQVVHLGTSVHSALETFVTMRYINLHLPLPLPLPLPSGSRRLPSWFVFGSVNKCLRVKTKQWTKLN